MKNKNIFLLYLTNTVCVLSCIDSVYCVCVRERERGKEGKQGKGERVCCEGFNMYIVLLFGILLLYSTLIRPLTTFLDLEKYIKYLAEKKRLVFKRV